MAGEAKYTVIVEDCIAAHRAAYLVLLRWPFFRTVLIIALVAGTLMALAQIAFDGADPLAAAGSGLAFAVIAGAALSFCGLLNYWKLPARARRTYAQTRLLHYPETIAWDDSHVRFTSERGSMRTPFTDYHRWADSRGVFLFYTNDAAFQLVPQASFTPEALADLRATLVAHGPPRR